MTSHPKLQLALDMTDLHHAVSVLQQTHEYIDIIEVGTLLCLAEGLGAIRTIRAVFPEHIIVGDVRIVRAGAKIAKMVFDAGANRVTVVAEAPVSTLEATCKLAREYDCEVQVELADTVDNSQLSIWQNLGIEHLIYHSETEVSENGQSQWLQQSLELVSKLCETGFRVTATGGIKPETISMFKGIPLDIIIAGRAIWQSDSPLESAKSIQQAIRQTYG